MFSVEHFYKRKFQTLTSNIRSQCSQRWNQLSRLQRSLVYSAVIIAVTVLVLVLCFSKLGASNVIPNSSQALRSRNSSWPDFTAPKNARQVAVVESFKHAWKWYKKHAWGHDYLKPMSETGAGWTSLGLTIVDSLDTAYFMGLTEEFEEGRQWIKDDFIATKDIDMFTITTNVLGALLSNYHFTKDEMFLNKAKDLGERLMMVFSTPSRIPYKHIILHPKEALGWGTTSTPAEVATIQLEFRELSRTTGNLTFEDAVMTVSEKIHALPKREGLVPISINCNTGEFDENSKITLGRSADTYYANLLTQWLQTGKTIDFLLDDYKIAIEGVRDILARRSSPNKYLFIGELPSSYSKEFIPKMEFLTCFLPGTLALGHANGLPDWHMKMAEELLYTCYLMYEAHPTFLAPEAMYFNMGVGAKVDMYTEDNDAQSFLRSEFVESLWIMYQITGNTTYQEWGWKVFQKFIPKMEHLACFLPGTLALGHANGLRDWHMKMAEELLYTCYLMYEAHPTFLAPEETYFNMDTGANVDMYTEQYDAHNLLQSEFVGSLWIMYQITGNTTYQEWGWKVFQAFEKHAKVSHGYTSLLNVKSEESQRDEMRSHFLSETIKYLYLLFSDDRFLIDLNKFVMNFGAHPLPIYKN